MKKIAILCIFMSNLSAMDTTEKDSSNVLMTDSLAYPSLRKDEAKKIKIIAADRKKPSITFTFEDGTEKILNVDARSKFYDNAYLTKRYPFERTFLASPDGSSLIAYPSENDTLVTMALLNDLLKTKFIPS